MRVFDAEENEHLEVNRARKWPRIPGEDQSTSEDLLAGSLALLRAAGRLETVVRELRPEGGRRNLRQRGFGKNL